MILTDAMALLYRSHFAFAHDHRLRTRNGRDTTVEFGFLATMMSLLELLPHPTHLAVVFDASGKTFRHELYTGYKGQRPPAPDEIVEAVPVVQEILRAMNIVDVCVPGVEADDVIATLAMKGLEVSLFVSCTYIYTSLSINIFMQNSMTVAIATPDKDFFQLLRPGLILLRPPKKNSNALSDGKFQKYSLVPYTEEDFREEWQGLSPSQFVDVLALMGDSSDNVPGVPGIGPKTATALLSQFGSLEEILENSEHAKPKRAATALSSVDGVAAARLSKQLVQLQTELDVPATTGSLDRFRIQVPKDGGESAIKLLHSLEFESHQRRIRGLWQKMYYNYH